MAVSRLLRMVGISDSHSWANVLHEGKTSEQRRPTKNQDYGVDLAIENDLQRDLSFCGEVCKAAQG
jgi:hypothetical protein